LGALAFCVVGLRTGRAERPAPPSADEVIAQWSPMAVGAEDFQQFSAAPKDSPGVAVCTFRVVGPSFERLWNHYADLCGVKDRYDPKQFLVSGSTSPKGTYIVSDRPASVAHGGRALSVFLLRTEHYTVTTTIQPDPDGKALRGSIAAVIARP
jgi:hypothetical protein